MSESEGGLLRLGIPNKASLGVTDFILARIAEDEHNAREFARHMYAAPRALAECAALRKIVELHSSWPVLVQTPPEFTHDDGDLSSMTMRMTQQIAWTTEREYRNRFGEEPPTAPMIRALASIWSDHPDFDPAWS